MSLSRWKLMAGVLGVSIGGLAAIAGQCPKLDSTKSARRSPDPSPVDVPPAPPALPPAGSGSAPKMPPAPALPDLPQPIPAAEVPKLPMPAAAPALPMLPGAADPVKKPEKPMTPPAPVIVLPASGTLPPAPPAPQGLGAEPAKPSSPGAPPVIEPGKPAALGAEAPKLPPPPVPVEGHGTPTPPTAADAFKPVPAPSTSPPGPDAAGAKSPVAAPAGSPPPLQVPVRDPLLDHPVVKPTAAVTTAATAAAPTKFRIVLRVGEGDTTFEVRCDDNLVLKVACERVDIKSPEKGNGPSAVKASGKVRFVGFGAEGTCDELSFLSGTGEVSMAGAVKIQVKDKLGRVESELTTESVKYRIDGCAVGGSLKP